jgi:hypothetical protein
MATIKFPPVSLRPAQSRNIIFEDWTMGMDTSAEGDNRDPRTSKLIHGLTNRYGGKLVVPGTEASYLAYQYLSTMKRFELIYLNDEEYILAWLYGKTALHDTLEITPTDTPTWTCLKTLSEERIVDEYAEYNENWVPINNCYTRIGQSFQVGENGSRLYKAMWRVGTVGTVNTGTVYAELYNVTGTYGVDSKPSGDPIATSDGIAASSLTPSSWQFVTFYFTGDNMVDLDPEAIYCIVIRWDSGDLSNYLMIDGICYSPSHPGNYSTYDGAWWANDNFDMYFKVWGIANVSHFDMTVASSDGVPVIYATYELDNGTGDTLRVSYRDVVDSMPYVSWSPVKDDNDRGITLEKSDDTGPPLRTSDAGKYGLYLVRAADETESYSSGATAFDYPIGNGTYVSHGQAFYGSSEGVAYVQSVTFMLKVVGTPSSVGNITVEIYYDSSGLPGTKLGTSAAIAGSTMTDSYEPYTFEFTGSERAVVTGASDLFHAVIKSTSSDGSNYVTVFGESAAGTTYNGKVVYYDTSWHDLTTGDLNFVVDMINSDFSSSGNDFTNLFSVGDILGLCSLSSGLDAILPQYSNGTYVSVAEVLEVGAEYIKVGRVPYPGEYVTNAYTWPTEVVKLSLDWLETVGSVGWHCRSISQRRPWNDVFANDAGIYGFTVETDTWLDEELVDGFDGNESLQYGISFGFEGGQNTGITTVNRVIDGVQSDDYSYMKMKIQYDYGTPTDDLLFRNWDSDSMDSADYVNDEVSSMMLWRRKHGEPEYGFLARIPRTKEHSLSNIRDIMADGASFWIGNIGEANDMLNFVNIVVNIHEDGSENQYSIVGFDGYFNDCGNVLSETFGTVTGIEPEDAQNGIYGRSVASIGQRLFIGNAHFPYRNEKYDRAWLDDEVVYSVSDCGSMFPMDNTLGYRTGGKDAIVNIAVVGTNLFIFKKHSCFVVNIAGANEFNWTPRGEFPQGLVDHRLMCGTPYGPAWFGVDGLYLFSENRPVNIAKRLLPEYMAAVATPSTCAIGYESRYDRLYIRLGSEAYWYGFDPVESGWKRTQEAYTYMSMNEDGKLIALGDSTTLYAIEGDTISLCASAQPEWHSGELTLGSCGEEIKLKRAYVWYEYERVWSDGDDANITLQWYIDGSLHDSCDLDVSTTGSLTSNLERVFLNGRGRRVEFRVVLSGDAQDWIRQFELKKVEIIYRTTRMK